MRGSKIARITSDLVRSRSSFEATAEEWRFQDEASRAYSSKVSRACSLTASQNHTLTVPYSHGPVLLRALCLASGTTEIRSGSDYTAKAWRFKNEAHRGTGAYDLGATPPR